MARKAHTKALDQTLTETDAHRARAGAAESTGRSGKHTPDGPVNLTGRSSPSTNQGTNLVRPLTRQSGGHSPDSSVDITRQSNPSTDPGNKARPTTQRTVRWTSPDEVARATLQSTRATHTLTERSSENTLDGPVCCG